MHSRLITPGDEFFLAVECKRLMMSFNSARRHTKRVKPSSDANRHLTRDLFDLMRGRTFEKVRKGSEKPMGNWQTAWTPTQNVNDAISTEVPLRNEKFSQGFSRSQVLHGGRRPFLTAIGDLPRLQVAKLLG